MLDHAAESRVSNEQLIQVVDRVRRSARSKLGERDCGDFSWILLRGAATIKLETCPQESVRLLSDLRSAAGDEKLRRILTNTLAKLGVR